MAKQDYEPVIGLEVHVQLATRSKLFCACPARSFGLGPNVHICPVCAGHPGVLPVTNRRAAELGLRAALALGCTVRERSIFARKNYFYPDLPKGYQISQYEEPFCSGGRLDIGGGKSVGIHRIHLEEDAGKLLHAVGSEDLPYSLVDLNRAGVPLCEIVSEPEIFSADEAYAYLTELKQVLQYLEVSSCDMEKGEMRCDANVSIKKKGAAQLGTRSEIKNLNSFKAVKEAIRHEVGRQAAVLDAGGTVVQETRLWNDAGGATAPMRSKEEAHDYRYFPEPDLVPLVLSPEWQEQVRRSLPELPRARQRRFQEALGLSEYDAAVLVATREKADFFEATLQRVAGGDCDRETAKLVANWATNQHEFALKESGAAVASLPSGESSQSPLPLAESSQSPLPLAESSQSPLPLGEGRVRVTPAILAAVIRLVGSGKVSAAKAKDVLVECYRTGKDPARVVEETGAAQVSDEGQLGSWAQEAIAENAAAAADYKSGKEAALGRLMGAVMKKSQGKANPAAVNAILKDLLKPS